MLSRFKLPFTFDPVQHSAELGVGAIAFEEMVYSPHADRYLKLSRVHDLAETFSLSGTEARGKYLSRGERLPDWYIRPEVSEILSEANQPRHKQGVCVWFTGLSCAGKSTIAEILTARLLEHGASRHLTGW